jgi:hypothetical protein
MAQQMKAVAAAFSQAIEQTEAAPMPPIRSARDAIAQAEEQIVSSLGKAAEALSRGIANDPVLHARLLDAAQGGASKKKKIPRKFEHSEAVGRVRITMTIEIAPAASEPEQARAVKKDFNSALNSVGRKAGRSIKAPTGRPKGSKRKTGAKAEKRPALNQIANEVSRLLGNRTDSNQVSQKDVARSLRTSSKTIERRVAAAGYTWKSFVDQIAQARGADTKTKIQ